MGVCLSVLQIFVLLEQQDGNGSGSNNNILRSGGGSYGLNLTGFHAGCMTRSICSKCSSCVVLYSFLKPGTKLTPFTLLLHNKVSHYPPPAISHLQLFPSGRFWNEISVGVRKDYHGKEAMKNVWRNVNQHFTPLFPEAVEGSHTAHIYTNSTPIIHSGLGITLRRRMENT